MRAQEALRFHAGAALVHQFDRDAETAMQLIGETPAARGGGLFAAIGIQRQPHHHAMGLPLLQQRGDAAKARIANFTEDDFQRARLARQGVADGDADLLFAKVETKQCFFRHGPHRPPA
ncbi:hypothetical protein D3C72_1106240 [compost metagenome]